MGNYLIPLGIYVYEKIQSMLMLTEVQMMAQLGKVPVEEIQLHLISLHISLLRWSNPAINITRSIF